MVQPNEDRPRIVWTTPFDNDVAVRNSSYSCFDGKHLVRLPDRDVPVSKLADFVHGQLRGCVLHPAFSCVGGRAAFNANTYRFGFYTSVDSLDALAGLGRDLALFTKERKGLDSNFTTFIASFAGPHPRDEADFETTLWRGLQRLHDLDKTAFDWPAEVVTDPDKPNFSFCFAGAAYFVVGMSPASSRYTRKFSYPTLVFNAKYRSQQSRNLGNPYKMAAKLCQFRSLIAGSGTKEQFQRLKEVGKFAKFQQTIRTREFDLQGSVNPNRSGSQGNVTLCTV